MLYNRTNKRMKKMNRTEIKNFVENLINNGATVTNAVKVVAVKVRFAKKGEIIETFVSDGTNEVNHLCGGGEAVVTNPTGESYAMSRGEFDLRYTYKGGDEAFPLAKVRRLIEVPACELPIAIPAPWDENEMMELHDGFLNIDDMDGIYVLARAEFEKTHRRCDETGRVL